MTLSIELTRDYKLIARLNEPVHSLHHELYPEYFKPYSYNNCMPFFREHLAKDNWRCYLACLDGKPVGYVLFFVRVYEENPFRKRYVGINIDQICVLPERQQRGVGFRLMEAVESFARQQGATQIELTFWDKNTAADTFYKKLGFSPRISFIVKSLGPPSCTDAN